MRQLTSWIAALLILTITAAGGLAPTAGAAQEAPATDSASATETAPEAETTKPSSLDLLLSVIENDDSRAALIEELRAAQTQSETPVDDKIVETLAPAGEVPPETLSFGRRVALITQEVAEDLAASLNAAWSQIARAPDVFDGFSGGEAGVLLEALKELALVIVVTIAVFLGLRTLGKRLYARMGAKAADSGLVRTVALFVASVLIDALIVAVSWAVGYLIATLLLGNFGQIGIRQTLYLNAFLMVELAKVLVRMVLSPSTRSLRLLPMADEAARYLTRRLNLMVGLVGYGQMLIVPIINSNLSVAAGRAVSALIALIVVAIAIWLVVRNRRAVADWLERGGQSAAQHAEEQRFVAAMEQADERSLTLPRTAELGLPTAAVLKGVVAGTQEMTAAGDPVEDSVEPVPMQAEEESPGARSQAEAPEAEAPARKRGAFHFLVRHWHWPALFYLLTMLVLVLVQPADAAFRSLVNSAQVVIVALVGVTLSGVLTRIMVRGVQLPDNVTARLPLLERRLNTFVPKTLFVLRFFIFVAVVAFALNAISLIDLRTWMASQFGAQLTGTLFSVAAVLLVSFLIWVALTSWVDYRLNPEYGSVPTSRERTLLTLLRNAATIALIIITAMFVLSEIGLDIAPLLASAGVLGLAIGFGAQKMVQDIITGIFIQFENAMNVGDVVTVGSTTGTVERLTIRSVSLRDVTGAFHVIPFSSVDMVTNFVRDFGYSVCDMGVAYRENIAEVKQAMFDAFALLRADPDFAKNILSDELEWFGVQSFGDSAVVVRSRIKCVPGTQWGIGRAYNGVLKEVFDDRNIEIPFPHQTIYLGESKSGKTQPFHVLTKPDAEDAQTV